MWRGFQTSIHTFFTDIFSFPLFCEPSFLLPLHYKSAYNWLGHCMWISHAPPPPYIQATPPPYIQATPPPYIQATPPPYIHLLTPYECTRGGGGVLWFSHCYAATTTARYSRWEKLGSKMGPPPPPPPRITKNAHSSHWGSIMCKTGVYVFPLLYICLLCDEVLLPWKFGNPGFDVRTLQIWRKKIHILDLNLKSFC